MAIIMENNQTPEKVLESIIRQRIQKRKQFYFHLILFGIGISVFIAKKYIGLKMNFFPVKYINLEFIIVWSIILITYIISFVLTEKSFGKKWEKEKIKKIIDSQKIKKTSWE